ncbi:hypothetical protein EV424DRAFT_1536019 [Suillus variegatus]|nr:hypothetical protein EV424DRAFT_1536019 [Suillus variegatus]
MLNVSSSQSMRQYRKSFHDHDPSVHLDAGFQPDTQEPPEWAKELMNGMIKVQQRLETLSPQSLNAPMMPPRSQQSYAESAYGQTPRTQTVNINTQPTDTIPESVYQNETAIIVEEDDELYGDRDDSPGQQFLEEELYKLRVKPGGSQLAITHKAWEVARDDQDEFEEDHGAFTESGLPEIPDSGNYTERRQPSASTASPRTRSSAMAVILAITVPIFSYLIGIMAALFAAWYTYGLAGFFWLHDAYHLEGGMDGLKRTFVCVDKVVDDSSSLKPTPIAKLGDRSFARELFLGHDQLASSIVHGMHDAA